MGLKQIIARKGKIPTGFFFELTMKGEPMLYSITYRLGNRIETKRFFRNKQWKSILKCCFKKYWLSTQPVVIIVNFYISPPDSISIKPEVLSKEKTPAVQGFELADYLLSFQEMLMGVLYTSHRQICRIETEKYYSDNPRTVMKFMKWEHYVQYQNDNSYHSSTESQCTSCAPRVVQSEC